MQTSYNQEHQLCFYPAKLSQLIIILCIHHPSPHTGIAHDARTFSRQVRISLLYYCDDLQFTVDCTTLCIKGISWQNLKCSSWLVEAWQVECDLNPFPSHSFMCRTLFTDVVSLQHNTPDSGLTPLFLSTTSQVLRSVTALE